MVRGHVDESKKRPKDEREREKERTGGNVVGTEHRNQLIGILQLTEVEVEVEIGKKWKREIQKDIVYFSLNPMTTSEGQRLINRNQNSAAKQ